jgi:hypothetical protein
VKDTASDVAEGTGEFLEGVSNTKVRVGLEEASATMRMEEIQEWLMPSGAAAGLNLSEEDREKTVSATYEYSTGILTIETAALSITGAQFGAFRSGPSQLSNVVARLHNPDGGLPFFDKTWIKSATVELTIGSVVGQDMHYGEGASAIGADSVQLDQLVINVANAGSAVPLTEGAGAATASFSVGRMALRGAYGAGTHVGTFDASGTTAAISENDGTTDLQIDSLSAGNIQGPRNTNLASASAEGLSLGINNEGTTLTSQSASIGDLTVGDNFALASSEAGALSMQLDHSTGGLAVGSDQLTVAGLRSHGTTIDSATASDAHVGLGPNFWHRPEIDASVGGLDATGVQVSDDFSAGQLSGSQMALSTNAGHVDISSEATSLKDIAIDQGTIAGLDVDDLNVGVDTKTSRTSVAANTVNLAQVQAASGSVDSVSSQGVTANIDGKAAAFDVGAEHVNLANINSEYGSVEAGQVNTVAIQHDSRKQSSQLTANALELENFTGDHFTAGNTSVSGLALSKEADAFGATLQSLEAKELESQFGSVDSVGIQGAEYSRSKLDGNEATQVAIASAQANNLQSQHGSATQINVAGLNTNHANNSTTASLDSGEVHGLVGPYGTSLEHGQVDGVSMHHAPGSLTGSIDRTRLDTLGVNSNGVKAKVGSIDLTGASGSLDGRNLEASLGHGSVNDISGQFTNSNSIGIPTSGVPYVDMNQHELDATLGLNAGSIRLGAGNTAVIQDVAGLIDSADVNASVPMRPGDLEGMATIRPDTTLQGGLQVRDGRLVTSGTEVKSSRPIDGPAWTTVNGAYLKETSKGGQVMADVGGFFDQNVTDDLTGGLTGNKSQHIPLEVGALANRLTENNKVGSANGSLELERENANDNVVEVSSRAEGLAAAFTRLLVASLKMKTPNGEVQTGRTTVSDAQLSTSGTPNMPSLVTGSVGSVQVESLSTKHVLPER